MKALLFAVALAASVSTAHGECKCLAVAGDVAANVQADVMKADGLYARGDFNGALALYAKAYATSKDASLLYAQGMCELQLGATDKARAQFDAYLKAGGNLVYKDRVEANLRDLGGAVGGTVGTVGGAVGGIGGGVAGDVTGTAAGVTGEVRANVGKPEAPKVGHKAAIVLGVIAVAAIGVVGIHSITAGVSTSAEFDPKFDIGLGAAGVAVGLTAFYVAGLGATAGAAGSMHCSTTLPKGTPLVAPIAMPGGGGVAAALSF